MGALVCARVAIRIEAGAASCGAVLVHAGSLSHSLARFLSRSHRVLIAAATGEGAAHTQKIPAPVVGAGGKGERGRCGGRSEGYRVCRGEQRSRAELSGARAWRAVPGIAKINTHPYSFELASRTRQHVRSDTAPCKADSPCVPLSRECGEAQEKGKENQTNSGQTESARTANRYIPSLSSSSPGHTVCVGRDRVIIIIAASTVRSCKWR